MYVNITLLVNTIMDILGPICRYCILDPKNESQIWEHDTTIMR